MRSNSDPLDEWLKQVRRETDAFTAEVLAEMEHAHAVLDAYLAEECRGDDLLTELLAQTETDLASLIEGTSTQSDSDPT